MITLAMAGILGWVLAAGFVISLLVGILTGLLKGKRVGYTWMAGAWLFAALLLVHLSRALVFTSMEVGVTATGLFVKTVGGLLEVLRLALGATAVAVAVLAAAKFDRKYILAEVLVVLSLCILCLAVNWFAKSLVQGSSLSRCATRVPRGIGQRDCGPIPTARRCSVPPVS